MLANLLELVDIACLAGFAFFIWPPAALLVVGVAAIFVSWAGL